MCLLSFIQQWRGCGVLFLSLGVSLIRDIAPGRFMLPLHRNNALSPYLLPSWRKFCSGDASDLEFRSTQGFYHGSSSGRRWSSRTLAQRLSNRGIKCQAGFGDGASATTHFRLVLEIMFVWFSENLIVFCLLEMHCMLEVFNIMHSLILKKQTNKIFPTTRWVLNSNFTCGRNTLF